MKSIALPAYMDIDRTPSGTTYYAGLIQRRPSISVLGYSEKEVKAKLIKDIEEKLTIAVDTERNYHRYIIGTGSGCVFIVAFKYGSWCYDICGPGREYASSYISNKNYIETVEAATKHARDDFGGIVFEHSF